MREINYQVINVEKDNQFFGLKKIDSTICFFIPIELGINEFKTKKIAPSVKRKIFDFIKTTQTYIKQEDLVERTGIDQVAFNSMIWLINHYMTSGYPIYYDEKQFNNQKGKIKWKNILKRDVYIQEDKLYLKSIISFRNAIVFHELLNIYKYCLGVSLGVFSWYFDVYIEEDIEPQNDRWIIMLEKERSKSFNTNYLNLLENLINIIKGVGFIDQSKNELIIGTNRYHHIYEEMLRKVLETEDEKLYYPYYSWVIDHRKQDKSKLRPDIIVKNQVVKKIYIIDAKFYMQKRLPESSDIQKQLLYAEYVNRISELKDGCEIHSVFILPYCNEKIMLKYFGYAKMENDNSNSTIEIGEIVNGVYIDLNTLIETFLGGKIISKDQLETILSKQEIFALS